MLKYYFCKHFFSNIIVWNVIVLVGANPQLNLPQLDTLSSPQTDDFYNTYGGVQVSTSNPVRLAGDADRSQRYGPPYQDEATAYDAVDDYRMGQTYMYDERNRYGSNYPLTGVQNFTRDSPFSSRDNSDGNARFRNHNYENPTDRFQDRYGDRFNERAQGRYNDDPNNNYNGRFNQENYPNNNNNNNNNNRNPNPNFNPNIYENPNPNAPPYVETNNRNPYSTANPNANLNPNIYGNPSPYPDNNNNNRNPNPYSTPNPNGNLNPNIYGNPSPYPDDNNRNPYSTPNPNQYPGNGYPNQNIPPFQGNNPQNPYSTPFPPGNNYPQNNVYRNNEDRFNLNDRENPRDRFRQDRRFQIELEKLRNFLVEIDHKGSQECTENVAAQWDFETNVNEVTQNEALNAQQRYVEFQRLVAEQSKQINKDFIFDRQLYRQLMLLSEAGPSALPLPSLDRYNRIVNEMLLIYNGAGICAYQQPFVCNLHYVPDLKKVMSQSRDWDELQHTWVEYHRKAGREMRDNYEQLIDVMNEIASVNNVTNGGEYWYLAYEAGNFRQDLEAVWEEIRPLYELLHAYVRRKLRDYYGPERINRNAPIPSHVLGNMFGQSWSNILDIIIPYPGRKLIDVTPRMREQAYNPLRIFQLAEEYFTSMNMSAVGADFYRNSVLEQPPDRRVFCEPSAWDFCNRHDFRVKMCTDIDQKSLISAHHEIAHIQYFLQYRHLPKIFRNGANPAFHQAMGDAIALSVTTPKHFQTMGLLQRSVDETSYNINYLFTMAIDKLAFLPYALALDNWRYDLFSGNVNKHMMNCHYWNLREKYGGIKPPVLRSEKDFDPGAKYHVPANIPYVKYFVSTILQFQIYRGMCLASGQYDPNDVRKPLHKCDVYQQPAAGNLLKQIMSKGASQPWQVVLQEAFGSSRLDGSALREYFAPLEEWLRLENLRTNEFVGWNYDGDYCKRSIETANLQVYGGFYNNSRQIYTSISLTVLSINFIFLLWNFIIN